MGRERAAVVVLGDIGRSPRMQYHALSLANQASKAPFTNRLPRALYLLSLPLKLAIQIATLAWTLCVAIPAPDFFLLQNPPTIPTFSVVQLACWLRGAALVIDWHNFGYTLLGLTLGPSHALVRIHRCCTMRAFTYLRVRVQHLGYERKYGRKGDAHLCVTQAMQHELAHNWDIRLHKALTQPPGVSDCCGDGTCIPLPSPRRASAAASGSAERAQPLVFEALDAGAIEGAGGGGGHQHPTSSRAHAVLPPEEDPCAPLPPGAAAPLPAPESEGAAAGSSDRAGGGSAGSLPSGRRRDEGSGAQLEAGAGQLPRLSGAPVSEEETTLLTVRKSLATTTTPTTTMETSGGSEDIELREDRPAVVVSSTSWTADEDFGVLLEAAVMYDRRVAVLPSAAGGESPPSFPRLLFIITGKGPQKEEYERRIRRLRLQRVAFRTMWLPPADYPRLLGCADLGVSLHTSSSGLDLPMKVVDMFGCGLPVCAIIGELVKEHENGLLFATSSELAQQLLDLFRGFPFASGAAPPPLLASLRAGALQSGTASRWADEWASRVLPLLRQLKGDKDEQRRNNREGSKAGPVSSSGLQSSRKDS
eukprot:jgi/Mesen1/9136/ME000058S08636